MENISVRSTLPMATLRESSKCVPRPFAHLQTSPTFIHSPIRSETIFYYYSPALPCTCKPPPPSIYSARPWIQQTDHPSTSNPSTFLFPSYYYYSSSFSPPDCRVKAIPSAYRISYRRSPFIDTQLPSPLHTFTTISCDCRPTSPKLPSTFRHLPPV